MLVIEQVVPGRIDPAVIDARVLCGDAVSVRVSRSGFGITYTPTGSSHWRAFDLSPRARDALQGLIPSAAIFGAFKDETPVGLAVTVNSRSNWTELLDLRVDTGSRQEGIGRALLEACQRKADQDGMAGLRAVISDANPQLCQFCEHCGFRLEGLDRLAFAMTSEERIKPLMRRASALIFYRQKERSMSV